MKIYQNECIQIANMKRFIKTWQNVRKVRTYSIVWVEDVGGRGIVHDDDLTQVPA